MYAEKVKFYNKVKEALRDELNKARKTTASPGEAETELNAPFNPTHTSSTHTGNQEITRGLALAPATSARQMQCLKQANLATGRSPVATAGITCNDLNGGG